MTTNRNPLDSAKRSKAIRSLLKDIAGVDASQQPTPELDNDDMLSLIADKILNGEDISKRYPALYQALLNDSELRQALIDVLEAVEVERNQQSNLPRMAKADLSFLTNRSSLPIFEILGKNRWRSIWRSTTEQVQAIFSPLDLAYRADPSQLEDPWFTLLRDEMETGGVTYAVALECTLSNRMEDGLAVFLTLAFSLEASSNPPPFPLRATFQWGEYQESMLITEQGRARFPDIPLATVMDAGYQNIKSGLTLSLETAE